MKESLLAMVIVLSGLIFTSCLGNETVQSISETELFSLPYGNFEEQLSVSDINDVGNVRFGIAMQDGFFYIVNGESKKSLSLILTATFLLFFIMKILRRPVCWKNQTVRIKAFIMKYPILLIIREWLP
jgi:hypothetical protein